MLDDSQYRILNKARQIGFSTLCAAEIAFYASRGKGERIVIISKNDKAALELMGYVRDMLLSVQQKDPDFVKIKGRVTKSRVDFEDGSRIETVKSSSETGRSISASRIYFDEVNFVPFVEDIYQAIEPTLSQTNGKMTMLSTPKGRATFFARICRDPESFDFSYHQYEWWWCPTYNPHYKQWFEAYQAGDIPEQNRWIEKAKEADWYKNKRRKHSELKFKQEFECSLDADVDVVFSQKQLVNTFYSHGMQEFWQKPDIAEVWWRKPPIEGHHYATGVDLGRKHDATVGVTYDITVQPAEIVEYYRIPGGTADWNEIMLQIRNSYAYYKGELRVDQTGAGDPIYEALADIAEGYIISSNQAASKKYILIENLRRAMDNQAIRMPKIPQLFAEHEKYTWNDKTIVQDSVIANALAVSIFYDPEAESTFLGVDSSFNYVEGAV